MNAKFLLLMFYIVDARLRELKRADNRRAEEIDVVVGCACASRVDIVRRTSALARLADPEVDIDTGREH